MTQTVWQQFERTFSGVSAYVILRDGKAIGKIILKWGKQTERGNAVTAWVQVFGFAMMAQRAVSFEAAAHAAVLGALSKINPQGNIEYDKKQEANLNRLKDAISSSTMDNEFVRDFEKAGFVVQGII